MHTPYSHITHGRKWQKSPFLWAFFGIFGVFWWFYPCQYGSEGYTFWFTHTGNHYKLDYKLTSYAYLILTLYIVRNDKKNHFFYVFRWWRKDLMPTRLMDRWECVLWTDGSPIPFPLLPQQNHWMWYSEHRLLTPRPLILAVGHGWVVLGLGLLSSWRYLVASRRDGG